MMLLRWIRGVAGAALVALLMISALSSIDHVIDGYWLPKVAWPTLCALIATAVVRGLGGRIWTPFPLGVIAGTLAAAQSFWPETLYGGWLPTNQTLTAATADFHATVETIRLEQSPIAPEPHVLAMLALSLLIFALVVETIALGLRSPAVAGVPALAVLATGAVLTGEVTSLSALLLAAGAWVGLLYVADLGNDSPAAEPNTPGLRSVSIGAMLRTAVVGAIAIAVLAAGATLLQPMRTGLAPEGQRFLIYETGPVDPASDLSAALRQGTGPVGIEYRSSTGEGVYLRTAVIHDVTAAQWEPRETGGGVGINGDVFTPAGTYLHNRAPATELQFDPELLEIAQSSTAESVELELFDYQGTRLPLADQPLGQTGLPTDQGWFAHRLTNTVHREASTAVDLSYESRYVPLSFTAAEIDALFGDTGIPAPESYHGLEVSNQSAIGSLVADPELQGTELQRRAQEITAEATSPIEVGQMLQAHFRNGGYTYSETAPVDEGYDGTGIEITDQFLQARAGYCIHFSSALALMARSVNVPARIVVGYAPIGPDGDGVHRVQARQAHAWPELYIAGLGWVPFEPTPSVGRSPSYVPTASSDDAPQEVPETTAPTEQPTQAPEPSPTPEGDPNDPSPGGSDAGEISLQAVLPFLAVLAAAVVLVALALTPHVIRSRRRRRRLGTSGDDIHTDQRTRAAVLEVWREVEDTAIDLGEGREPYESEDAFAARLARLIHRSEASSESADAARVALPELASLSQWARYGAPHSTPQKSPHDAGSRGADVVRALSDAAEQGNRRQAWWLPRSLLRR